MCAALEKSAELLRMLQIVVEDIGGSKPNPVFAKDSNY